MNVNNRKRNEISRRIYIYSIVPYFKGFMENFFVKSIAKCFSGY